MTEVSGALLRLLAGRPVRSWRLVVAMPSLRAPLNLLHALLLPHMLVPPPGTHQPGGIGLPRGPCHPSGHWVARHQSEVMSAAGRRDTPCLVSSPGERAG